jgi:hypothetical protein
MGFKRQQSIADQSQYPIWLKKYFKIGSSKGDGNCGFRSLSVLQNGTEDGFMEIRQGIYDEYCHHFESFYNRKEWQPLGCLEKAQKSLVGFAPGHLADRSAWYDCSQTSIVASNFFRRPVIVMSHEMEFHAVPIRHEPSSWLKPPFFLYYNNDHLSPLSAEKMNFQILPAFLNMYGCWGEKYLRKNEAEIEVYYKSLQDK